jgi:Amt family ammonium transporter
VTTILCYLALDYRIKKGIDESLDAWAIHGIGGSFSLAVGLFATKAVNNYAGLLFGNLKLLEAQVIAVVATVVYAFVVTFVIAKIVDTVMGLRVSEVEEYVGLDISQHGEVAYS